MAIERLEAHHIRVPLKQAARISRRELAVRECVLVRIRRDAQAVGDIGYVYAGTNRGGTGAPSGN
jgi:hypothetical protein